MPQLELFSEFHPKPSYAKSPQLTMSCEALKSWKQRIFEHQQSEGADQPQQGSLFELAPNPCDPNAIEPI
ncbi:hypothetical protein QUA74_10545 [Microcoleus sp. LAD1_D3]|uniref:hypothetical protein n=1 Tax=Microcoleus sp. LAD1_D3 TaxID=2819365 RepID=UPI002FD79998